MLQIKNLRLTHKKDLRTILDNFNLVLNDGDKAVIIGEEGQSVPYRGLHRSGRRADNWKRETWLSPTGAASRGQAENCI